VLFNLSSTIANDFFLLTAVSHSTLKWIFKISYSASRLNVESSTARIFAAVFFLYLVLTLSFFKNLLFAGILGCD